MLLNNVFNASSMEELSKAAFVEAPLLTKAKMQRLTDSITDANKTEDDSEVEIRQLV